MCHTLMGGATSLEAGKTSFANGRMDFRICGGMPPKLNVVLKTSNS